MDLKFLSIPFLSFLLLAAIGTIAADNMPWSVNPPGGLTVAQAPMFVMIGFDDNSYADGINWFLDFIRNKKSKNGCPARVSFFLTSERASTNVVAQEHQKAQDVVNAWKRAYADGHELGNHSNTHPHGTGLSKDQWVSEMTICNNFLRQTIGASAAYGFRTPFLEQGPGTYQAIKQMGFTYDCSIEWGYGCGYSLQVAPWWMSSSNPDQRKLMQVWPYTLDKGAQTECSGAYAHGDATDPGVWGMTVFTYLKPEGGEVTGFDFNVFAQKNAAGALATWRYNFDLLRSGNKCPMSINAHTDYYSDWNADAMSAFPSSTVAERRKAVEDFVSYVLQFDDVIMVPMIDVIRWMRHPIPYTQYRCGVEVEARKVEPARGLSLSYTGAGASASFAIHGDASSATVSVTDMQGRRIFSMGLIPGRENLIALPPLARGVYLVNVADSERSRLQRIVVSR
jgi:hypothetical protein